MKELPQALVGRNEGCVRPAG